MRLTHNCVSRDAEAVFVHSPYPGLSKFVGEPSSLLFAIEPFVSQTADDAGSIAVLDFEGGAAQSHLEFDGLLRQARDVRLVGISTSTAAIAETRRLAAMVKDTCGPDTLTIVGGPHEDDIEQKSANVLDNVDLSIAGDGEHVLAFIGQRALATSMPSSALVKQLMDDLRDWDLPAGRAVVSAGLGPVRQVELEGEPVGADSLRPRLRFGKPIGFSVFEGAPTHQVMVSRGCSYGKCTFCAEANQGPSVVMSDLDWLEQLVTDADQEDAIYFQDSIFPVHSASVRERVLPLLARSGRRWGCQVFLGALSDERVRLLVEHGCQYVYTGLESGVSALRIEVGKTLLTDELVAGRMAALAATDMKVGISIMFGALGSRGVHETPASVANTIDMAKALSVSGLDVAGFFPNVQTLLPGTVAAEPFDVDFYEMPRYEPFDVLEDGGIGYNFATIEGLVSAERCDPLVDAVREGAEVLRGLAGSEKW